MAASAHILRQDNDIHVELHLPPDDRPTSKTTAPYELLFEDEAAGFTIHDYQLDVTFLSGSTAFAHHTIKAAADGEVSDTIVFPKPGDYTIKVHGISSKPNGDFTVSYPAHVFAPKTVHPIPVYAWMLGGATLAALLGTAYLLERKKPRPDHPAKR
jgi:hypothetical protein